MPIGIDRCPPSLQRTSLRDDFFATVPSRPSPVRPCRSARRDGDGPVLRSRARPWLARTTRCCRGDGGVVADGTTGFAANATVPTELPGLRSGARERVEDAVGRGDGGVVADGTTGRRTVSVSDACGGIRAVRWAIAQTHRTPAAPSRSGVRMGPRSDHRLSCPLCCAGLSAISGPKWRTNRSNRQFWKPSRRAAIPTRPLSAAFVRLVPSGRSASPGLSSSRATGYDPASTVTHATGQGRA